MSPEFATGVERLRNQIGHWTAVRFGAHGPVVHALVQRLADLSADAEHRPRRAVPRLDDTALADQLAVVSADLLAASPSDDVLADAVIAVRRTAATLH